MNAERDFFISYTQADRAWAEWLAWELEAAGYTTMVQAWDMPPGIAFAHVMDQAAQTSGHTVLVLSPAYLRSPMAEAEWRPGFVADPSGEERRLLPVRVETCKPKGLLADRVWIDLVGMDEATARAKLREDVAAALRGHSRPANRPRFPRTAGQATSASKPRFPTALPPVWNVPFRRNPSFTGREQALTSMAARWLREERSGAVAQVLQGGAGVGKTALAVEYAYRQRAAFDTVWWVRGEESAALVSDYAELALAMGLHEAALHDQQVVAAAVRNWLEHNDRWLLIFDNAAGPETDTGLRRPLARSIDLLPRVMHGQVLITSRDVGWEQHSALIELEPFTPREALDFLLARSGTGDDQTAPEVAEVLGFLPLALEQAGAYVQEARISLSDYLDRLRRFPALTLAKGHPRDRNPEDTVASTWQVSLERVRSVPGSVALLEVCAFLAPEDVPRSLFAQALDYSLPDELAVLASNPFALDEAIVALRRYALIKASESSLTVHRLLQQIVREGLDQTTATSRAGLVVRLLAAAFPREAYLDQTVWADCMRLLTHVLAATDHAEQLAVEPAETSRLLSRTAGYLQGRAQYGEARELVERALAIAQATLGPEHYETGIFLNELGLLFLRTGDPKRARPYLERALAVYTGAMSPDSEVATTFDNLGQALRQLGDLTGARQQLNRALEIKRKFPNSGDPTIGITIANLGNVLHDLGDLTGAREHHEDALAAIETTWGPNHPYMGIALVSLGRALRDLGDLAGAEVHLRRAHDVLQATLGPEHPHTQKAANQVSGLTRPTQRQKP